MRRTLLMAAALTAAAAGAAEAAEAVTLQLKWVTPGQFAGYYVAKDQGFYEEEGLEITINPGGPDIAPPQVIGGGGADVIVEWMPAALASREKGVPLVNIAQPFKRSGMMLTCRKETGIAQPADLKGRTLGVCFYGNEYWQVIDAGLKPEDLTVFKYEDQGVATLEDGLYVLEGRLLDPGFADTMAKFVRASMKGWAWTRDKPEDAAAIVLDNDATGAQTEQHQVRMVGEINKLTQGSTGVLDPADYERTVQTLLSGGSDPVITKAPEGAWTHVVSDAA